jgi:hypothetical protein
VSLHDDWEHKKVKLIEALALADVHVNPHQIKTDDWGCPHTPKPLPEDKMAVYTFFWEGRCLKVGKAGPNSGARYTSQHYLPGKSKSNLADSILSDAVFLRHLPDSPDRNNIGDWLKRKTRRINLLLDETLGPFVLNFAEAFLQVCFKPEYEGYKNQREPQNKSQSAPNEKSVTVHKRGGNPEGYISYENHFNPHITIHVHDGKCGHIEKHGGGDAGGGKYTEHRTLEGAYAYAKSTGLPVKECHFCKKRYGVANFSDI